MPSKHAVMEGAYDFHKRLIRSHVTDVTAGSHVTAASGRDLIGGEPPCRESHHCSVTAPRRPLLRGKKQADAGSGASHIDSEPIYK